MPPHDPHRMEEGQRGRVAADSAAGLVHQASQGEVGEQQAVQLLLGEVRPAAAQHQPPTGQADLQLGEGALALPALVIQGRQLRRGRRGRRGRVEQGGVTSRYSGSAPGTPSSR